MLLGQALSIKEALYFLCQSQPSSIELDTKFGKGRQELRQYPDKESKWAADGFAQRQTGHELSSQLQGAVPCCCGCARHLMLTRVLLQDVEEPEAKAAVIWILGEHGFTIQVSRLLEFSLRCCQQGLCCRSKHASLCAATQCLTGL